MANFEEVTCSVCVETFVDPVILDCGHNLCHRCALRIYNFPRLEALQTPQKESSSKATSQALPENAKNGPTLLCPLCQRGTRIDPGRGVHSLPRNVVLKKFLEEISSRSTLCDVCEESAAVKDCLRCEVSYCLECLAKSHSGKAFAHHQIVPVGSCVRTKKRFCQIHSGQATDLFCLQDKAFVCSYCAMFTNEHKGHECVPEATAVNSLKGEISAAAVKIRDQEEPLRRVRECSTAAHTNNAATCEVLVAEVEAAFHKAQEELATRRGELVQEIRSRMAFEDEVHVLQMQSSEMLLSRLDVLLDAQAETESDPYKQLKWLTDSTSFLTTAAEASPRWAKPAKPAVVLDMEGLFDVIGHAGLVTTEEDLTRAEEEKRVEAQSRLDEARRLEEGARKLEEQKRIEEQRRSDDLRRVQEEVRKLRQQKEEARRLEEGARKLEEEKRVEEQRRSDELRILQEEVRKLRQEKEEARRLEEARRIEEARKFQEMKEMKRPALVGSLIDEPTAQRLLEKVNTGKWLRLLYRASADGFSNKMFHDRCNYKGPTFTIAKSNTAVIFGGYTSVSWDSSGTHSADASAFLFRVNSSANVSFGEVITNGPYVNNAVYRDASCGPYFGSGGDLSLPLDDVKKSRANGQHNYSHANFPQCSLVGSRDGWFPTEVEVFGLADLPTSST